MPRVTNDQLPPDITSRDFGRIESDVANIKENVNSLTQLMSGIDKKMDGVVTRNEFTEFATAAGEYHKATDARLFKLEEVNKLRAQSIWTRIGMAADKSFVSIISKAIFLLFGWLIAVYLLSNYQLAPKADEPHTQVIEVRE